MIRGLKGLVCLRSYGGDYWFVAFLCALQGRVAAGLVLVEKLRQMDEQKRLLGLM